MDLRLACLFVGLGVAMRHLPRTIYNARVAARLRGSAIQPVEALRVGFWYVVVAVALVLLWPAELAGSLWRSFRRLRPPTPVPPELQEMLRKAVHGQNEEAPRAHASLHLEDEEDLDEARRKHLDGD